MSSLISRYATPFTIGLFLVSAISGAALFFHWESKLFHGMHEWLSMVLLLPVALHIQKNWFNMVAYFQKQTIWAPLLLSLLAAGVFVGLAFDSPGRPPSAAARLMAETSLATAAPAFGLRPEALATKLAAKGYGANAPSDTLAQIARKNGKTVDQLFQDLVGKAEAR